MSTAYALTLPYPPSSNTYYRRAGRIMHLSAAGKAFKTECAKQIAETMGPIDMIEGRVGIQIELFRKDRTAYDIDNYVKSVVDVLKGTFFEDDRQVDWLVVKRREVTPPGFCEVVVSELDPQPE